jgi:hypothetical protein
VQQVLDGIDDESLRVYIVWTAAISSDHYDASVESRSLISDSRARHYWDGERALGHALSPVLGTRMRFAWDVYLAYEPGTKWETPPPEPADWLHQKQSEPAERYLEPAKLETMLKEVSATP